MANLEATGTLVLVLALGAVSVMVLLLRNRRTNRDLPIWLASTFVGCLLGAAGTAAVATGLGYKIVKTDPEEPMNQPSPAMGMGGSMPGMGGPPGMGRGGPGMGMMGGRPSPKSRLTTLVRKIELLTGDIKLTLTPEQSATIATMLDELKATPTLSDDEANAKYEQLLAVLDDNQKAKQESIRLPFGGGFGRPGGGPSGGPGGPGGGRPNQAPDANPFADEENAKALNSLLSRLSGSKSDQPAARTEISQQEPKTTTEEEEKPDEK